MISFCITVTTLLEVGKGVGIRGHRPKGKGLMDDTGPARHYCPLFS